MVNEPHGLGHLEPELTGHHRRGEVRAADPGGKGPQSPVGAGVAVGADHEIPRSDDPLLRQQRVLDTRLADLEVVADVLFAGEIPHELALFGGCNVFVRGEVIRDKNNLLSVENPFSARFPEDIDRDRGGDVIPQRNVHLCIDQHAGLHRVELRVPGKNLFRDRHPHFDALLC